MSHEAKVMLENLNAALGEVEFKSSVAGVLFGDSISGQQLRQVISNLATSSDRLAAITTSLDSLSKDISEGEGTIHYLATDTVFVNKLEQTMLNIEEGTARFNENMEALKHSFLTRRYFKKQEKEKAKNQ